MLCAAGAASQEAGNPIMEAASAPVTPATSTPGAEPDAAAPGAAYPGWYVSLGPAGARIDLESLRAQGLEALGIDLERRGSGGRIQAGYAFGNAFALQLAILGTTHDTGRDDVEAQFGQVYLEAVAPLARRGALRPFVAGGLGGAALELTGRGVDDTRWAAAATSIGGGLRWFVSRHLSLVGGYRYTIQNFETKIVRTTQGQTEVELEATGNSHVWGGHLTWSF